MVSFGGITWVPKFTNWSLTRFLLRVLSAISSNSASTIVGVKFASVWKLASWDVSPGTQFSRKPTCKTRTTARYNCLTTYIPSWPTIFFFNRCIGFATISRLATRISHQPSCWWLGNPNCPAAKLARWWAAEGTNGQPTVPPVREALKKTTWFRLEIGSFLVLVKQLQNNGPMVFHSYNYTITPNLFKKNVFTFWKSDPSSNSWIYVFQKRRWF